MQDPSGAPPLRPVAAGCGRMLADRRLRPHHPNQPLKCPRCDSANTKFCYYNNYNLSQPRHFCKNCRRYWTKGGVLRNVPVGGGCRKAKRSKTQSSQENRPKKDSGKASPRSSSESSSLTATEPSAFVSASDTVHAFPSTSSLGSGPPPHLPQPVVSVRDQIFTFPPERRFFSNPKNPTENVTEPSGALEILPEGIPSIFQDSGNFTSFISGNFASSLQGSDFGFSLAEFPFKLHHQKMDETAWRGGNEVTAGLAHGGNELTGGLTEMFPPVNDLSLIHAATATASNDNPGLVPLEWQTNTDPPPALFDLPTAVDPGYWGQNQWEDHDQQRLFLP